MTVTLRGGGGGHRSLPWDASSTSYIGRPPLSSAVSHRLHMCPRELSDAACRRQRSLTPSVPGVGLQINHLSWDEEWQNCQNNLWLWSFLTAGSGILEKLHFWRWILFLKNTCAPKMFSFGHKWTHFWNQRQLWVAELARAGFRAQVPLSQPAPSWVVCRRRAPRDGLRKPVLVWNKHSTYICT